MMKQGDVRLARGAVSQLFMNEKKKRTGEGRPQNGLKGRLRKGGSRVGPNADGHSVL